MGEQLASSDAIKKLRSAAEATHALGAITMLVGVIGAVILGLQTEPVDGSRFADETYPYVAEAIAVGFGAFVTGTVLRVLGHWADAWAILHQAPGDTAPDSDVDLT